MLNSFVYMFRDKDFWKKYLSLFGVLLIANLLINWSSTFSPILNNGQTSCWYYILFFVGLIVLFIPYGYSISLLKAKLEDASLTELPSIKIMQNFISGFKVILSALLLILIIVISAFVLYNLNSILYKYAVTFMSFVANAVILLAIFVISFFLISMCCRYVVKPSFLNFINFKEAAKLINYDAAKYLKAYLLTVFSTIFVYLIIILSVSVLTRIGYIGLFLYCVLVSLLWSYQIFLFAGLFSKAVLPEKI